MRDERNEMVLGVCHYFDLCLCSSAMSEDSMAFATSSRSLKQYDRILSPDKHQPTSNFLASKSQGPRKDAASLSDFERFQEELELELELELEEDSRKVAG